ncbi:MAG: radical SAM protein [Capsulimonas sp.]|uniref:radical SAM protein n=1 Tax=Capsulimonas sp. TaxID=2494211 RepID=UPI00326373C1
MLNSVGETLRNTGTWKSRNGPDGIHLFDRWTGINILVNEVIPPKSAWASAPRQMSIALTNACDLHCPFCYAPKHHAQLNLNLLKGWLVELDQNGCLSVGFGGGEPTLFRQFSALCNFAATETRLATTFTTHAHRIDERLAGELSGNVHFIRVSIDGVGATYERIRGRSFASLLRQLEIVRKIAPFGINVVVNSSSIADLDELDELAERTQASELLLLPEQPARGRDGIDPIATERLQCWVEKRRAGVPLRVSQAGSEGMPVCDPLPGEAGLRAYAHLDASGILRQSSYTKTGIDVGDDGIIAALSTLRQKIGETTK